MSFDLHQPQTVDDALGLAASFGARGHFIAGGTDLVVQIGRGRHNPDHLIDLSRIEGLNKIDVTSEGFRIGAMVTHKTIERHPSFQSDLTMLAEAAHVVGGHQVRNVATIGGNIANASPAADVVAPLLALDAVVTLESASGLRQVALDHFLLGSGKTDRRADEMLTAVHFSRLSPGSASVFLKNGRRKAMEISVVCVAACLTVRGSVVSNVRISLGAVAPRTLRARSAEAFLEGQAVNSDLITQAACLASEDCQPIDDVRASADYRRMLVSVLVARALEICIERQRSRP